MQTWMNVSVYLRVIYFWSNWGSTRVPAQSILCCLTSGKLFPLCGSVSFRNGTPCLQGTLPEYSFLLLWCLQSWVLPETAKIRLNMKLVGFLNPLLVSHFNKRTSILRDVHRGYMLALHKVKHVSWIFQVCWI